MHFSELRNVISNEIGSDFLYVFIYLYLIICKSTTMYLKIQTNFFDNYRTLIHFLNDQKAEYHTFQFQADKSFRVVIKNIHPTTDPSEISTAIKEIGFTVKQVIITLHHQTKISPPLFFVDLTPETISKQIFNITSLLNTKIKVEEPHKCREFPQCQNCQNYGHTKSYYTYSPRCVKCGESHSTASCLKSPDLLAKYALCNGNNPINYKGCVIYKELQQRCRLTPSSRNSNQQQRQQSIQPIIQQAPRTRSQLHAKQLQHQELNRNIHMQKQQSPQVMRHRHIFLTPNPIHHRKCIDEVSRRLQMFNQPTDFSSRNRHF